MGTTETGNLHVSGCELCLNAGGALLWYDELCRVVSVADADYPGFCRVILQRHVAEMTDLCVDDRARLMRVVFAVENALRKIYRPDKINIASFGNLTPHVHWHVIPRWRDDRHFPNPTWGLAVRNNAPQRTRADDQSLSGEIAHLLTPA